MQTEGISPKSPRLNVIELDDIYQILNSKGKPIAVGKGDRGLLIRYYQKKFPNEKKIHLKLLRVTEVIDREKWVMTSFENNLGRTRQILDVCRNQIQETDYQIAKSRRESYRRALQAQAKEIQANNLTI